MGDKVCKICLDCMASKMNNYICFACLTAINRMPKKMPLKEKIIYLKTLKLNGKLNSSSLISKREKDVIEKCQGCDWLRFIDYGTLKVYCSLPNCRKNMAKKQRGGAVE